MPSNAPRNQQLGLGGLRRDLSYRIRRQARLNGTLGVAKVVLARVVYSRADFLWFRASVEELARQSLALIDMDEVAQSDVVDVLADLWDVTPREGEAKRARGGRLWLGRCDGALLFSAWTFNKNTDVPLGRRMLIPLPENTVVLEQVFTASAWRGRGIAPGAFHAIASQIRDEYTQLLAVVSASNHASQRAFAKAGFAPTARTSAVRIGPWYRVRVVGDTPLGTHLRSLLVNEHPHL